MSTQLVGTFLSHCSDLDLEAAESAAAEQVIFAPSWSQVVFLRSHDFQVIFWSSGATAEIDLKSLFCEVLTVVWRKVLLRIRSDCNNSEYCNHKMLIALGPLSPHGLTTPIYNCNLSNKCHSSLLHNTQYSLICTKIIIITYYCTFHFIYTYCTVVWQDKFHVFMTIKLILCVMLRFT